MPTDETMIEIKRMIDHGDLDAAGKQLDAIASGNQSSPTWWLLKGRVETRQGQLQSGTDSLEKAIELDPHDPDALFSLAYVCDLHGDDERAVELYQQCVSTPPMRVYVAEACLALERSKRAIALLRQAIDETALASMPGLVFVADHAVELGHVR